MRRRTAAQRSDSELTLHQEELSERLHIETRRAECTSSLALHVFQQSVFCVIQIEPYLPYEFTCEGMLQRVNAFIENQVLPLQSASPSFPRAHKSE